MIEVSSLIGGCWAKEGSLGVGSWENAFENIKTGRQDFKTTEDKQTHVYIHVSASVPRGRGQTHGLTSASLSQKIKQNFLRISKDNDFWLVP